MGRFLTILLLLPCLAIAQKESLYFERITTSKGLSNNKINCITRDFRGFTWIGTDDGLNRYDGKQFIHFKKNPGDSSSIPGNIITDIYEAPDRVLWIATADGGLARYDYRLPAKQQFRQFRHRQDDPHSLPVNNINRILPDRNGNLWLGTSGRSVILFDRQKEIFIDLSKSSRTILDLCTGPDGWIWVGRQGGGIMKIDPASLAVSEDARYSELYAKLPHVTVTALHHDSRGDMWFGSWDKVVYRQGAGGKEVFEPGLKDGSFAGDEVLCIREDSKGRIWMGGKEKGLHVYDPASGKFFNYTFNPSQEGSIGDNRINCIYIDPQHRLWLGTNRGISISSPGQQQFVQQFLAAQGSQLQVYDFFEERSGNILIGTSNGLYRKSAAGLTQIPLQYQEKILHITSFFQQENGNILIGTNASLFELNPATGKIKPLPGTEKDGVMKQLIESRITSISRHRLGAKEVLTVAPYGHFLAYYEEDEHRWVSRLHSQNILEKFNIRDNLIRKILRDSRGRIWLATTKSGLGEWNAAGEEKIRYHQEGRENAISSNHVFDIAEDGKGNLWISTYGGGLNYFNTHTGRFTRIAAAGNLAEGIALDNRKNIWMISNGGIHQYNTSTKEYISYSIPDAEKTGGLRGNIFKDSKGYFYAGGINFYIRFHPDSIHLPAIAPAVHFTGFSIFNEAKDHLLQEQTIRLSHRENYFTIEFSAPEYSEGSPVQYAYMLEGFDRKWIEAGERNFVSYSNLEGGSYVFRVKATGVAGKWEMPEAVIRLEVVPPFWKTSWFFILVIAGIIAIAFFINRYRIRQVMKREAIRNRIAQDLHDNVGSTLSSISVYSQVARIYHQQQKSNDLSATLERISSTSGDMISELNDTVWALNARNDNMRIIVQKMESFARPLLNLQGIKLEFDVAPALLKKSIPMEKRKNCYLVFKEAINNAIKYAGCDTIRASLSLENNWLEMKISDNGRGFRIDPQRIPSSEGGNGLQNMKKRAEEIGGKFSFGSEKGRGTTICFSFPVT